MSFRYKDKEVTTKNYKDIFGSYPVDILDEIRLAIADNTEIARYIDICGTDSYKLNQLRLAIREGVEKEFLNPAMTGRTLYLIRQGLSMCMDVDKGYIAFNTDGYTNAGLIISNAYGWDGNGNFNNPTSDNYIRIRPTAIDYNISGENKTIGRGGLNFLASNQDVLDGLRVFADQDHLRFSSQYGTITLDW